MDEPRGLIGIEFGVVSGVHFVEVVLNDSEFIVVGVETGIDGRLGENLADGIGARKSAVFDGKCVGELFDKKEGEFF